MQRDEFLTEELAPGRLAVYDRATGTTLLCRAASPDDIDFSELANQREPAGSSAPKGPFDSRTKFSTLVMEVTDGCNLRCEYCSRYKTDYSGPRMPQRTIVECLRKAAEHAIAIGDKVVVQFHGGEPLLHFKDILSAIQSISTAELESLDLRVQTNGTLLDQDVIADCNDFDIHIGLSVDGPPSVNGINRRFSDGTPVSDVIEDKIRLVRSEVRRSHISCLCVMSTANVARAQEVFNYIVDQGIDDVSILPLYPDYANCLTGCKAIIPRPDEMIGFATTIFDAWIARLKRGERLSVPTFQVWVWNLLAANAGYLVNNSCCGVGESMLFVSRDGRVYPCGPFSYEPEMDMGDIHSLKLTDFTDSDVHSWFLARHPAEIEECRDCALQAVCRSGCPANAYRESRSLTRKDPFCDYWKGVISHVLAALCGDASLCELIPEYSIRL
jgi:uncharacterized protein